jgi:polysaccharide transporter, PST family
MGLNVQPVSGPLVNREPAHPSSNEPTVRQAAVGQSIARGALALLSTQPLTWATTLLSVVALPRLLGADVLGQLTVATTISSLGAVVCALGVTEFLIRRVAQTPETLRRDAGIALIVQASAAVLGVLAIGLVVTRLTAAMVDEWLVRVCLLSVLGAPLQTVLSSSLLGRELHARYAWFIAIGGVLSTLAGVLTLALGGGILLASGLSGTLSIATSLVAWKVWGPRPVFPRLDRALGRDIVHFIRGGLPFMTWSLTLTAYGEIDRVILGALVPSAELGWYASAYKIIGLTVFVPALVARPLLPVLSRIAQEPETLRQTIKQTLRVMVVIMVPVCMCTIVVAPMVPRLLGWPADFENSVPLMVVLALHMPAVAVNMVLGAVLLATHREARWVMVGIAATVFNVVGNFVAIPAFEQAMSNGALGAAIVTVLTEILMGLCAVILLPKTLLDRGIAGHMVRLALGGAAGTWVGLALHASLRDQLPWLPLLAVVCAGAAVLINVACGFYLRAWTLDDLRELRTRVLVSKR